MKRCLWIYRYSIVDGKKCFKEKMRVRDLDIYKTKQDVEVRYLVESGEFELRWEFDKDED